MVWEAQQDVSDLYLTPVYLSPAVQAWREERRQYVNLLRQKKSAFWSARVDADRQQPGRL